MHYQLISITASLSRSRSHCTMNWVKIPICIYVAFYRTWTGFPDYNAAQTVIFPHILQVTQAVTPAFSESLALFGLILPRDRMSLRAGEDLTFSDIRYSKHFLKKTSLSALISCQILPLFPIEIYYNCSSTLNYCVLMLQSLKLRW